MPSINLWWLYVSHLVEDVVCLPEVYWSSIHVRCYFALSLTFVKFSQKVFSCQRLVKGECVDGTQTIHRLPRADCLPSNEHKREEKKPCVNVIPLSVQVGCPIKFQWRIKSQNNFHYNSIFRTYRHVCALITRQMTVIGSVGACLLLCVLLSYLYKKTRRLEYKYMRLVSNAETPAESRHRRLGSVVDDDDDPDDEISTSSRLVFTCSFLVSLRKSGYCVVTFQIEYPHLYVLPSVGGRTVV